MKMKANAIVKRDMTVRSRSYTLAFIISLMNIMLFIVGIIGSFGVVAGMKETFVPDYSGTLRIYCLVVFLEYVFMLFAAPLYTIAAISGERESGTLDLLLVTNETPFHIVTGKLISAMIPVVVIILSGLPAMLLPLVFGGVGVYETIKLFGVFIPMAFYMLCIGIFASSVSRTVVKSTALTYGIIAFLLAGTLIVPFLTAKISPFENNTMAYLIMVNPLFPIVNVLSRQIGETGFVLSLFRMLNFVPTEAYLNSTLLISFILMLPIGVFFFVLSILNITPGRNVL